MIGANTAAQRKFVASSNHTTIGQRANLNTLLKSGAQVKAPALPNMNFHFSGGNGQLSVTRR